MEGEGKGGRRGKGRGWGRREGMGGEKQEVWVVVVSVVSVVRRG